jgi:hypothetical protein
LLRVTAAKPPVEHRIGVRDVSGFGEFYDRITGASFVPRGNNYIRLAQPVPPLGVHNTFNVETYDEAAADAALRRMAADG